MIDKAQLVRALRFRSIVVRGQVSDIPLKMVDAGACRDTSAQEIYNALFEFLIDHLNVQVC